MMASIEATTLSFNIYPYHTPLYRNQISTPTPPCQVRMMASMEAGMNAVERQKFYIDNVEREDDTTMLTTTTSSKGTEASKVVPDSWPTDGAIVGQNVQMRYRDGPLVLKGTGLARIG